MVTIPDILRATEPMRRRLEAKMKPAPLYREVRNMPPPESKDGPVFSSDMKYPAITLLKAGDVHPDPYEWFEPRR